MPGDRPTIMPSRTLQIFGVSSCQPLRSRPLNNGLNWLSAANPVAARSRNPAVKSFIWVITNSLSTPIVEYASGSVPIWPPFRKLRWPRFIFGPPANIASRSRPYNKAVQVQWVTGAIVALIGIAATARLIPALADYTYPLVWWGALLLIDAWNERRVGRSLWRGSARHFLLITVPTSVLYWLLFELLNLASPQWRYRGNIESVAGQSLFGFVSFATVIPIMVEAYWLVMGTICLPRAIALKVREWKAASIITGLLLLAVPLWNRV